MICFYFFLILISIKTANKCLMLYLCFLYIVADVEKNSITKATRNTFIYFCFFLDGSNQSSKKKFHR